MVIVTSNNGKVSGFVEWISFMTYGVGHVLNDMVASMWFTYAMVYYHYVVQLSSINTGIVIFVGQITDAVATAAIGVLSDKVNLSWIDRYGRRKTWHLFGSLLVNISLPFAFSPPAFPVDSNVSEVQMCLYYCFYIVIFQIGWAAIENSHMALVSDLTPLRDERTALLSIRYTFTVFSNILVYVVTWVVLRSNQKSNCQIGPSEMKDFQMIVMAILFFGVMTTLFFHIGVREPNTTRDKKKLASSAPEIVDDQFFSVFKNVTLYQTTVLYMCSRVIVNMTLVFLPMYLIDYLKLEAEKIPLLLLTMFFSSFCMSLLNRRMNVRLGRKYTYSFGVILALCCALWCYVGNGFEYTHYDVYIVTITIGVASSVLLVTSQGFTTDFIGSRSHRGAFIFGLMSFSDKVSCGVIVMVVQYLRCDTCPAYYRDVMIYSWTIPACLAFVAVVTLPNYGEVTSGRPSSVENQDQKNGQAEESENSNLETQSPCNQQYV
ncbi:major facilitator superfamily domain-containing protein 12-like [Adelges cooleyi]|uniref:major facilitator superfamily domain-containing protein 12-like n=1 Tax=Adelges cooleyi TaxID=133065 RepID=UPI0021808895|nr:major facilitator superfamily domain-containing protein 12-like [Adelges cooleyi]